METHRVFALRIILTTLSVLAISFIFFNSSLNADDSSLQSGLVREFLNSMFASLGIGLRLTEHAVRKTAHFVEYFVLGGLLTGTAFSYTSRLNKTLPISLPLGLLTAIADEISQSFSDGRSCQISDMALDFSAVVTAAAIFSLIVFCIHKKALKKEAVYSGSN